MSQLCDSSRTRMLQVISVLQERLKEIQDDACLMVQIFCAKELEFEPMIISEPGLLKTRLQRLPQED